MIVDAFLAAYLSLHQVGRGVVTVTKVKNRPHPGPKSLGDAILEFVPILLAGREELILQIFEDTGDPHFLEAYRQSKNISPEETIR